MTTSQLPHCGACPRASGCTTVARKTVRQAEGRPPAGRRVMAGGDALRRSMVWCLSIRCQPEHGLPVDFPNRQVCADLGSTLVAATCVGAGLSQMPPELGAPLCGREGSGGLVGLHAPLSLPSPGRNAGPWASRAASRRVGAPALAHGQRSAAPWLVQKPLTPQPRSWAEGAPGHSALQATTGPQLWAATW